MEDKGMEFSLSAEQVKKFKEWKKDKVLPQTAIGGAYTICFTPTGLGDIVEVRCVDGTSLSLTDYDTF
jgi:hypothetical protein